MWTWQSSSLPDRIPTHGFNTTEQNALLKEKYPDKFILNGSLDPREGVQGLEQFEELIDKYNLKGVKLYTAEWKRDSKGWKRSDPSATKYLELGVKNIHVHKGPTIWPLNRDAFDVADVDEAASEFPNLNFIVEHVGLPRLEDFCWIGTQEPNVYGGLAVAMPFIHTRRHHFSTIIGELHYASEELITSVNSEGGFDDAFPGETEGPDLEELRTIFRRKSFVSRQARLCRTLISEGRSPQELATMRLGEMAPSQDFQKYLERRKELGLDASEEAPLVVDPEGNRVPEEAFIGHLRSRRPSG